MSHVDKRLCIFNAVNSVYRLQDMEKVETAARILDDVRPTLIMERNKQAGRNINKAWKLLMEAIVLIDKEKKPKSSKRREAV